MTRSSLLSLVVLPCVSAAAATAPTSVNDYGLVHWITSNGGIFNPKQEIRNGETSGFGIFAKKDIEEGEVLAQIPATLFLGPESTGKKIDVEDDFYCEVVANVANELEKGTESDFSPYMQYLASVLETSPGIPSAWSSPAKALLYQIIGGDETDFPPRLPIQLLDLNWYDGCNGDEELESVAGLVLQKAVGDFMIPLYDMYTHRNGDYFNVNTKYENGKYIQVLARRAISAGEQLHNSFDLCDECDPELVEMGYGTLEIFRDRGIVESFPQRFSFRPGMLEITDNEGETYTYAKDYIEFEVVEDDNGEPYVKWADHIMLDDEGRNFIRRVLRKELRRLYRFDNVMYDLENDKPLPGMQQNEWNMIVEYYNLMKNTLRYVIKSMVNDGDIDCPEGASANEGFCPADSIDVNFVHYDDLGDEEDHLEYIFPDCNLSQIVEFRHYRDILAQDTNYQRISFGQRVSDEDICMNLETTLQICASYRPHYHEFFVHFPARYIETIKRVVFVGGGDSMLLHEVLKYSTLEKVVGLELDQQVTRKSFKYFHSQPHFDNDKVEWWYGDATKSLPLLPKDYWGSFDLVLVDLSETVMSMSVTGELDIFAALSLLLKPEGIMVKNEPYLEQFSQFFDYTIHAFYGTPKICTQVLSMGSNGVDFLHHPVKEHNDVERLLLEPLEEDKVRFKYMHEYVKTDARKQGKCLSEDEISVKHGKKAGILEVIDAENTSVPLDSGLLETLKDAVEGQGLSIVSEPMSGDDTIVFVMKEGYIVARMWPENQYCAMDLNLWGRFQKQQSIRQALLGAVGSNSVSSFRIVVGGMHGTNTWEEDKEVIGIQVAQTRNCEDQDNSGDSAEATSFDVAVALDVAMTGLLENFVSDGALVVVACGLQDKNECPSLEVLSAHPKVKKVMPIWTCPDVTADLSYTTSPEVMYECEESINNQMEEAFGGDASKVDLFVLDSGASYTMAQIFQSLLSLTVNRENWLASEHVFVSPVVDASESRWRQNFMERLRKENSPVPVTRAEIEIRNHVDDRLMSLGLFAANDQYFFNHLYSFEETLKKALSVAGKIEIETPTILGGVKYFDDEYNARVFEPEAYDAAPAVEQAASQVSMGRQSVFQFEFPDDFDSELKNFDGLAASLGKTFELLEYVPSKLQRFNNVGEGGVLVSMFAGGDVLVLSWDGRSHVDVNLFSHDDSEERADKFLTTFADVSGLLRTLRDDQPRGTGRVIQFTAEI